MHTRRGFLIASAATAAFGSAAWGNPRCIPDPKRGGQLCKTFVDVTDGFQETYHARHEPSAIWVACVAVVFACQGHVIQQLRIAEEAYGGFDKVPTHPGFAATAPLERTWKDDDGVTFQATIDPLFDTTVPFDQGALIGSLSSGHPVILGGVGHPVVLTALAYAQGTGAQRLVAGMVFDPTPLVGPRALDIDEVVPSDAGGDLSFAFRTRLEKV